ncbi:unnamed protein product [Allacma fusca]|uniref:Uncharacterized protein n=1 Tax=Allacma fusca TaxID=39272 RepID=A0A8J2J4G2_9HEXA|nr:unnamed protein product [Allacma fusca]
MDDKYSNRLESAINRGLSYLETLFGNKPWAFSSTSYTKDRINFTNTYHHKYGGQPEKFTHYLALDLLGEHFTPAVRSKLEDSLHPSKLETLNYFVDQSIYPSEADTTSLGYITLLKAGLVTKDSILPVAEIVFGNVTDNGVVELHFKPITEERRKGTICACTCANVLHLAYTLGEESKLRKTESYVFDWLNLGNWKRGTLYYPNCYAFLYFCSNFADMDSKVQEKFRTVLLAAIKNSIQDCRFPLDYALVILALTNLDQTEHLQEISEILLGMQEEDGSFPPDAMWGDRHGVLWGGKALSTILIVGALAATPEFL